MGWSSRTQGYPSEGALVTALAIFQRLRGEDPLAPAPYLKTYLEKDLKRAAWALARFHPDITAASRRSIRANMPPIELPTAKFEAGWPPGFQQVPGFQ